MKMFVQESLYDKEFDMKRHILWVQLYKEDNKFLVNA